MSATTTPKIYFDPAYANVPAAMKEVDQWLAFRVTWNPEKEKFDKTPLNSRGQVENNHQGGESFATMLEYAKRNPNTVLGFFVRPPFIVIDGDGCVDLDKKEITSWAGEILETGSYQELSPSGTGIHIFGLGTKPGNKSKKGSVEIYTDKRAVTVTGRTLQTSSELCAIDITNTYNKMVNGEYVFGEESAYEREQNERASAVAGGNYLIHHGGKSLTNKLVLLSAGDYTPDAKPFRVTDEFDNWVEYPSQSEAHGALLVCLAAKFNCDYDEIEQAYFDTHLSENPYWANDKFERLKKNGNDQIKNAIKIVQSNKGKLASDGETSDPPSDPPSEPPNDVPAETAITIHAGKSKHQSTLPNIIGFIQSSNMKFSQQGAAELLNLIYGRDYAYRVISTKGAWVKFNGRVWENVVDGTIHSLLTQLGKLLVNKIAENFPKIYLEGSGKIDPKCTFALVLKLAAQCDDIGFADKVVRWFRHLRVMPLKHFDAKPNLINFQNGTYDLSKDEFRGFAREDLLTQIATVKYNPDAINNIEPWLRFLEISIPSKEVRDFQQVWFGYCMTGDNREKKTPLYHGDTNSGKTTMLIVIASILGFADDTGYACYSQWSAFAEHGSNPGAIRNDLARLHNARMVICDESSRHLQLDQGIFKQAVGNTPIVARFLNKEHFTFTPHFKMNMATNFRPSITGDDSAFWEKIMDTPMSESIGKNDPRWDKNLKENLMAVAEGVAAWMIEGHRKYKEHGLQIPQEIIDSTLNYRQHSDIQGEFLREMTIREEGAILSLHVLHERHTTYMKTVGDRTLERITIAGLEEDLVQKGYKVEPIAHWAGKARGVLGIRLNKEFSDTMPVAAGRIPYGASAGTTSPTLVPPRAEVRSTDTRGAQPAGGDQDGVPDFIEIDL